MAGIPGPLEAWTQAKVRLPSDETDPVTVPATVGVQPGDRLLAVRGSGRALGFVAQGPIYEEALKHPELACFGGEVSTGSPEPCSGPGHDRGGPTAPAA
jgi:hypothetical protein